MLKVWWPGDWSIPELEVDANRHRIYPPRFTTMENARRRRHLRNENPNWLDDALCKKIRATSQQCQSVISRDVEYRR
jgi:hypothetical protein